MSGWLIPALGVLRKFRCSNPEGEEEMVTIGDTSRIVMVAPDGTQTDVAILPSVLQGGEGSGGSRLAMSDGMLYATSGGWVEDIPADRMPLMAAVVAVGEDGSVEEVANTWDFEASENPDGFVLESHPYGLAAGPDGLLWVADAGANTVYTVDPESGEITLVATLDGVESPLPNPGSRRRYGNGSSANRALCQRRMAVPMSRCFLASPFCLVQPRSSGSAQRVK